MGIGLSKAQLIEIVDGRSPVETEDFSFTGLEYDSREIRGGELFVALKGETTHGHSFVQRALERGAALCLVEDCSVFDQENQDRLVEVDDSLKAFWKLASWWREHLGVRLAGVTGSVGKTMVKELTASLLLKHSRGAYSLKSFNNHVGVPYTICSIDREHSWAVLEMGMNHPGELSGLTQVAKPDAALITQIAAVHQEAFDSLEQIADAKCEIFEGLREGGTVLLNADDPVLRAAVTRKGFDNKFDLRFFGTGDESDVQVLEVEDRGLEGISFKLKVGGEKLSVDFNVLGKHNAMNAAAAVLIARTLEPEISIEEIKEGFQRFTPPRMRLNIFKTRKGRTVIDDSYNANPTSMRGLFDVGGGLTARGQKVGLVLGDMLELGSAARGHHLDIAKAALELEPVFVVAVGEFAEVFVEQAKLAGVAAFAAASPEAAAHTVSKLPSDVVLIKASRGIGLDRTVRTLLDVEGEIIPQPQSATLTAEADHE